MTTEVQSIVGSPVWRRLVCPPNHRITIQNASSNTESWGEIFIGTKPPINTDVGFKLLPGVESSFNIMHNNVIYVRGQYSPMLTYMLNPLDPADIGDYTSTPTTTISLGGTVQEINIPAKHTVLFQQLNGESGNKGYISFNKPLTIVNGVVTSDAYIMSYLQFMAITLEVETKMYIYGPGLKITYKIDPSISSIPDKLFNELNIAKSVIEDLKLHKLDTSLFEKTVIDINKYITDAVAQLENKKLDKTTFTQKVSEINTELLRLEDEKADRGHNHAGVDIAIDELKADLEKKVDKTTHINTGFGMMGGGQLNGDVQIDLHLSSQFTISPSDGVKLLLEDSLNSLSTTLPLTARQGGALKSLIDVHTESTKIHITDTERLHWNSSIVDMTKQLTTIMSVSGEFKSNLDNKFYDMGASDLRYVRIANIVNTLDSISTTTPLSANMGKALRDSINTHTNSNLHVQASERSLWNGYSTLKLNVSTYDTGIGSVWNSIDTILARLNNTDSSGSTTVESLNAHKSDTVLHTSAEERAYWNSKINTSDVVDHLNSHDTTKPLSANMGRELAARIPDGSTIGDHLLDSIIHITPTDRSNWNSALQKTQVINHVASSLVDSPLSANMGRYLNEVKVEISDFERHTNDFGHITNEERISWTDKVSSVDFTSHINSDIHVTQIDRSRWDEKVDPIVYLTHVSSDSHITADERILWNTSLTTNDVIDNLESNDSYKPLSANMGRELSATKVDNTTFDGHINNSETHITPSKGLEWDAKIGPVEFNTHVLDHDAHFSPEEREKFNTDMNEMSAEITTIKADVTYVKSSAFFNGDKTLDIDGYTVEIIGPDQAKIKTIPGCTHFSFNDSIAPDDDVMIDWGDGTTNSMLNHVYETPGQYIISVYGNIVMDTTVGIPTGLFSNIEEFMTIRPDVGYSLVFRGSLNRMSYGGSVKKILAPIFSNSPEVTNFSGCFMECAGLTEITYPIIDNNKNSNVDITDMFRSNTLLNINGKIIGDSCTGIFNIEKCYAQGPTTDTDGDIDLFDMNKCVGASRINNEELGDGTVYLNEGVSVEVEANEDDVYLNEGVSVEVEADESSTYLNDGVSVEVEADESSTYLNEGVSVEVEANEDDVYLNSGVSSNIEESNDTYLNSGVSSNIEESNDTYLNSGIGVVINETTDEVYLNNGIDIEVIEIE
ncbi:MAG: hypothetical protein ACRCX2_32225 [Paraclostridium sp.]